MTQVTNIRMVKHIIKRKDLLYPDLSYKIIGALFNVYNNIGSGHREIIYQRAIAIELKNLNIPYDEQLYVSVNFRDKVVGTYYLDFLIDNKIVLELKKGDVFLHKNIGQIFSYLKAKKLKLGILANFTKSGLKFKRIVNINS